MITLTVKLPPNLSKVDQQKIAMAARRTVKYLLESDFRVESDVDFNITEE